jgi:hypothetical protein
MNQQHYQCSIVAAVSPEAAFNSIRYQVGAWWTNNIEGSTGRAGDIFTVRFGNTFAQFTVTALVPGKKITWLVTDCNLDFIRDKKEWLGTEIRWEIEAHDEGAAIHMTHIGLAPGKESYSNCSDGWNFYIKESLFKLLTTGEGQPNQQKNTAVQQ